MEDSRLNKWAQECGEEMYGDYRSDSQQVLHDFAEQLQSMHQKNTSHASKAIYGTVSDSDIRTLAPGDAHNQQPTGSILQRSGKPSIGSSSSQNVLRQGSPGYQMLNDQAPGQRSKQIFSSPNKQRQFFELCVNTGELAISLGEIDITHVENDQQLFTAIHSKYRELRGIRLWRVLIKPRNIHFVLVCIPNVR